MKLLGFAALLLAIPVWAAAPAVRANQATAKFSAASLDLAKQMAPRDLVLEAKLREFDRHFGKSLLLNDDIKNLEAQFPGAVAAMAEANRPLLAEQTVKIVDQIQEDVARLLTAEFSADELASIAKFYRSPHARSVTQTLVGSWIKAQPIGPWWIPDR